MIKINDVSVIYKQRGPEISALENVSTTINDKEFLCVIGPSGCGKSTLIHVLAGFVKPTSGEIHLNGNLINEPNVNRGVIFQQFSLFPWLTVRGNIEFGLQRRNILVDQRNEILKLYLQEMQLSDFSENYPNELSVGMQQRVAIARAFANDPDVLLMDEPFASIDAQTKIQMRELLVRIWEQNKKTVVFVTHDVDEAITLADRIIVLSKRPGRIIKEVVVDLPRPRNSEIFMLKKSIEIRNDLMGTIFN